MPGIGIIFSRWRRRVASFPNCASKCLLSCEDATSQGASFGNDAEAIDPRQESRCVHFENPRLNFWHGKRRESIVGPRKLGAAACTGRDRDAVLGEDGPNRYGCAGFITRLREQHLHSQVRVGVYVEVVADAVGGGACEERRLIVERCQVFLKYLVVDLDPSIPTSRVRALCTERNRQADSIQSY